MRGMRVWAGLLSLALAASSVSLTSRPALAQSAADKETARGLMADGRDKRGKGDHKGALEAFRAAHKIMGVPTTGLEVGREEAALGMLIEARDTLLAVARMPEKPGEPEPFAKARAEAQALADQIAPRIGAVKLVVKNLPPGDSHVIFDGDEASGGILGVPRKMNPGTHTVVVRAGGAERTATFTVAEGVTNELEVDFTGATPIASTAQPDKTPPSSQSETETTTTSPLVWIGLGVAAAGVVVGSTTGLMHLSKTSSLKDRCPGGHCAPDAWDDYDSAKRLGTISTISFAVAAVGAGVFVIGLASPSKSEKKTTSASLVVGAGSLSFVGAF